MLLHIITFILAASLAFGAEQNEPEQQDLMLMTPYKWAGLNENDERIFTLGVLEYWGFAMYSYKRPELSDFVACVNQEETKRFYGLVWAFGNVKQTAVRDILKSAPTICSPYQGKGNGSREPLHILKKSDWKKYNLKQKAFYAMGYVEAAYVINKDIDPKVSGKLNNCVAGVGIEGLMSQVLQEEKAFNWNHPLPWLIAPALGTVCQEYPS